MTAPVTAAERLAGFGTALRAAGVAVDAGRTVDFLAALERHPPADAAALHRLGRLVYLRRAEDRPRYDAAFDAWFLGRITPTPAEPRGEEEETDDGRAGDAGAPRVVPGEAGGLAAATDERLGGRRLAAGAEIDRAAARLAETAAAAMPLASTRRRRRAARGDRIDLARTAALARRTQGVPLRLAYTSRPRRPRRLVLAIDVSGSLKTHAEGFLAAAHALAHAGLRTEVFTFATRLTRVTADLAPAGRAEALARVSQAVHDLDGGTRIGPALARLAAEPRHQRLLRGAVVAILSDGLERGDPEALAQAVERLARLSYRLVWLNPLAARPGWRPATRGMLAALPFVDLLADGSGLAAVTRAFAALPAAVRRPRGRAYAPADLGAEP